MSNTAEKESRHFLFPLPSYLEGKQQKILVDLLNRLNYSVDICQGRDDWQGDWSNVFGVLGPRGSGKTTILNALTDTWKQIHLMPQQAQRGNVAGQASNLHKLILLPSLTCSEINEELPPGTVVLLHIKRWLENTQYSFFDAKATQHAVKELSSLAQTYIQTMDAYRELLLELSSSEVEYRHNMVANQEQRLFLQKKLRDWLTQTLSELSNQPQLEFASFVIPLDDFDLLPKSNFKSWLGMLLDEMRQSRILFVLSADFSRLEKLCTIKEENLDDKTGRALVHKILPRMHRFQVKPWDTFQKLVRETGFSYADLVAPLVGNRKHVKGLLQALKPRWPRGIIDFFESVVQHFFQETDRGEFTPKTIAWSMPEWSWLLELLATTRGEPLLAKEFGLRDLNYFFKNWKAGSLSLSTEDWKNAVEVSQQRVSSENIKTAIPGLIRDTGSPWGNHQAQGDHFQKGGRSAGAEARFQFDPSSYPPDWSYPIRHVQLEARLLKDASDSDSGYWMELLADLNMNQELMGAEISIGNRIRLTDHWRPVQERVERAHFALSFSKPLLAKFFSNKISVPAMPGIFWMDWYTRGERVELSMGVPNLIEALRGRRDRFISRQFQELNINPRIIRDPENEDYLDDAQHLQFIPDETWAIILWADALDRCCWSSFAETLDWDLAVFIALAAAFLRTAYVYPLVETEMLAEGDLSSSQKDLLKLLRQKNPRLLCNQDQEKIVCLLADFFHDDIESLITLDNSLSRALGKFMEIPSYQAVKSHARILKRLRG